MKLNHLSRQDIPALLAKQGYAIGLMNPDEYHATKDDFPIHVSKSTLCKFIQNPYKAKNKPFKGTSSTEFGLLVDCLTLTPELFDEQYVTHPHKVSLATKEGKALKAEATAQGKTLFFADANKEAMTARDNALTAMHNILGKGGYSTQVAVFINTTTESGLSVVISGLIDILPHNVETFGIWDLKTTSCALEQTQKLCSDMHKFGYPIQAAMYIDLVRACGLYAPDTFTFLFVESNTPNMVRCVTMDEEAIADARASYFVALDEYAQAQDKKDFGSPILPAITYTAPKWSKYDNQEEGEEF